MRTAATGAQNERTALAWQRTALSVIVASLALSRLTYSRVGWFSVLNLAVAVPLCAWVFLESRDRYEHDTGLLPRNQPRGGRAPAILAVSIVGMALTELAAITRVL